MSLIKCPECNKEISDKADSCPNCGFPIDKIKKNIVNEEFKQDMSISKNNNVVKKTSIYIGIVLAICLLIGFFVYPQYKTRNVAKKAVTSYLGNPSTITFSEIELLDVDTFYSVNGEYTYVDGFSMTGTFKVYVNKGDYNIKSIWVD